MIVIGADTHKGSHALAAVVEGTGRVRGSREINADEPGHLAAVRWARGLDEERVWALEDCRHVSRRPEQALLAAGERVVRVSPGRMGVSRKGERWMINLAPSLASPDSDSRGFSPTPTASNSSIWSSISADGGTVRLTA